MSFTQQKKSLFFVCVNILRGGTPGVPFKDKLREIYYIICSDLKITVFYNIYVFFKYTHKINMVHQTYNI